MFFGCYLLTSANPEFKNHTYIGFTVNPVRRLKQHNGQITGGAFKTFQKKPWWGHLPFSSCCPLSFFFFIVLL